MLSSLIISDSGTISMCCSLNWGFLYHVSRSLLKHVVYCLSIKITKSRLTVIVREYGQTLGLGLVDKNKTVVIISLQQTKG